MRRPQSILTERQHEVLALMLDGLSHRRIAKKLGIATRTVQCYIVDIWDRLSMPTNRWYAIGILNAFYQRHGPQVGEMVEFGQLAMGQQFKYKDELYHRVERGHDKRGPYNALNAMGDRDLFYEKILVEVLNQ